MLNKFPIEVFIVSIILYCCWCLNFVLKFSDFRILEYIGYKAVGVI